jgi:DNA-binding XRE family transcriptional regulator
MKKVKYIIEVNESTASEIKKLVDYHNMKVDFGELNRDKIKEEDIIKAAIAEYLNLFSATQKSQSLLTINMENNRKIQLNIKPILKEKGMKQADLAHITGINKANISDILNHKYLPGLEVFIKIWVALDCPPLNEIIRLIPVDEGRK